MKAGLEDLAIGHHLRAAYLWIFYILPGFVIRVIKIQVIFPKLYTILSMLATIVSLPILKSCWSSAVVAQDQAWSYFQLINIHFKYANLP